MSKPLPTIGEVLAIIRDDPTAPAWAILLARHVDRQFQELCALAYQTGMDMGMMKGRVGKLEEFYRPEKWRQS